jgi:uridine phosphorylase
MKRQHTLDHRAPILTHKAYDAPSVFEVESLLREARRQRGVPSGDIPAVCVLDPDGDLAEHLIAAGQAAPHRHWACYHTRLYVFTLAGAECGVIPYAVGASFAVLVAEELFASGCRLLISITSAGQIVPAGQPPYFVLIERALRDEGTSYHYLSPAPYSALRPALKRCLQDAFADAAVPVLTGATWTTDAPFRETSEAIAFARAEGILGVEMEAAALYAFAEARGKDVVCFAHITNQMAVAEGDFEKGRDGGSHDALQVIGLTASQLVVESSSRMP